MSTRIQCRACGSETDTLRPCACGSKSFKLVYRNDMPQPRHAYVNSGGTLEFTEPELPE